MQLEFFAEKPYNNYEYTFMDLNNLLSIYGKPTIVVCPVCNGNGCDRCHQFGYLGQIANSENEFTIEYPMYVDLKKRDETELIRNVVLAATTVLLIVAVVSSYIINIAHGG